jgi:hypothetical protein
MAKEGDCGGCFILLFFNDAVSAAYVIRAMK